MTVYRDFEQPGRSEAVGANGMVATSHPRATLAALDVLRAGGNAVDAAVCAAAVQAVVEPTQTGIGGDCFALLMREGDTAPTALNGSGWTPEAASLDWYRDHGISEIEVETPHSVTVPGAIAAWEKLVLDHGCLPWDRVLAPAIEAAEDGSCVPERLARDWGKQVGKLTQNPEAARLFLFDGNGPRAGVIHRQPALAKTLRAIAKGGARAFYTGDIADKLVKTLRGHGGLHRPEDFAEFSPEYVTAISTNYRGFDLWECPPNGQGIVPMLMAKALEGFDLSSWRSVSVERFHVQAEVARQAYAERDLFVADPRTGKIPVDWLLSDEHIRGLRQNISLTSRIANVETVLQRPHRDTVFISVVDRDRMAVSLINSVFEDFGSGIACEKTGVLFHNRASSFVLEDGHPNCIAGRKRPMHTIIPAMLAKDGQAVMPFGVTGAHFQPFGQVQILTNVVDYGMSVQAAIDHPRMFARGDTLEIERSVPEEIAVGLTKLGHRVTRPENPLGTAQAIWIDRELGVLRGGADGRRDGIALGY
jgi:gamma-glutamyltranspeptidase/glutathione hydrolase